MSIANRWTVVGAVLCAAACSSEPAADPSAQTAEQGSATQSTAAGSNAASASAAGSGKAGATAVPVGRAGSAATATAGSGGVSAAAQPAAAGATAGAEAAAAGGGGAAAGSGAEAGSAAPVATEKFSFFVTSLQGMRDLSKSEDGFGGDLRYGEETGLKGADKICTELAELSMPGAGAKGWHAFLSAAKASESGGPVHAKDRIGKGPWYDRLGRVVAMGVSDLLKERPGADPAIADDLPNERGEPNHTDTTPEAEDNHDTITGTNAQGEWDGRMTCQDWTSTDTPVDMMMMEPMMMMGPWGNIAMNGPGLGHSWPSDFSGSSWMAAHPAPGCSPSVALVQMGGGQGTGIGNSGGYGGIYCFAETP